MDDLVLALEALLGREALPRERESLTPRELLERISWPEDHDFFVDDVLYELYRAHRMQGAPPDLKVFAFSPIAQTFLAVGSADRTSDPRIFRLDHEDMIPSHGPTLSEFIRSLRAERVVVDEQAFSSDDPATVMALVRAHARATDSQTRERVLETAKRVLGDHPSVARLRVQWGMTDNLPPSALRGILVAADRPLPEIALQGLRSSTNAPLIEAALEHVVRHPSPNDELFVAICDLVRRAKKGAGVVKLDGGAQLLLRKPVAALVALDGMEHEEGRSLIAQLLMNRDAAVSGVAAVALGGVSGAESEILKAIPRNPAITISLLQATHPLPEDAKMPGTTLGDFLSFASSKKKSKGVPSFVVPEPDAKMQPRLRAAIVKYLSPKPDSPSVPLLQALTAYAQTMQLGVWPADGRIVLGPPQDAVKQWATLLPL